MEDRESAIRHCIEKFGVFYQKTGQQAMMGRLMGYLMLAEPPHKTFEEITEFLLCSKSAVSNTLHQLMYVGMVDYVKFPGDRKRYFRLNQESWDRMFEVQLQELADFRGLVGEALKLRSRKYPETNRHIEQFYKLMQIYEEQFPEILGKWKKQLTKKKQG
ncbi:MAG TPA: hypothetical protein VMC08_08750 [Bacteroidales bacterium]|nr:hypothetical protein [Bacteroidales bacterium]